MADEVLQNVTAKYSLAASACNVTGQHSNPELSKFTYNSDDFIIQCQTWETKPQDFKLSKFDKELRTLWDKAMSEGCFKYTLDCMETKVMIGKYKLVAQLNEKRFVQRRKPQQMSSVSQPFDPQKFNFTKVASKEILFEVCPTHRKSKGPNLMIINVSPLEFGNSLLVPCANECLPQVLTEQSLELAFEVALLSSHRGFHIGYNSLCAFASVNHLHFHVWYLDYPSQLESLPAKPVCKDLYEVTDFPTRVFMFQLRKAEDIKRLARKVHTATAFFVKNEIAHNLSIVRGDPLRPSSNDELDHCSVRIYLWPRQPVLGAKDESMFNIAVCEMGGHLPIRTREFFNQITEQDFCDQLQSATLEKDEFERIKTSLAILLKEENLT